MSPLSSPTSSAVQPEPLKSNPGPRNAANTKHRVDISPFSQLPPEMLSEIASQITSKRDLIHFSRVNRAMHAASKRFIYQNVDVDLHDYFTVVTPRQGSVLLEDGRTMDGFAASHLMHSVLLKQESAAAAVKSLVFRGAICIDEDGDEASIPEKDQVLLGERFHGLLSLIGRLLPRTHNLKTLRLIFPFEVATANRVENLAELLFAHQSSYTFLLDNFETSFLLGSSLAQFLTSQPHIQRLSFRHQCIYIPHFETPPQHPILDADNFTNLTHISLSGEWSMSYLLFLSTNKSRMKELVLDVSCGWPLASSLLPLLSDAPLLKNMAVVARLGVSMENLLAALAPISLKLDTLELISPSTAANELDLSLITDLELSCPLILFRGYVPPVNTLKRHFIKITAPKNRRRFVFLPTSSKKGGKRGVEVHNRKGRWTIGAFGGCLCCGH